MEKLGEKKPVTAGEVCYNVFNNLNHILVGFVCIYITYGSFKTGYSTLTLHTILCTLGYQLLMAEGILALAPGNVWSHFFTRRTKTILHWILQAIGALFALVGMIVEYRTRNRHFGSLHAKLGLASGVFLIITLVNGITNLYAKELSRFIRPVFQRFFHNLMALATFVLGMASLYYGYEKRWVRNIASDEICWMLKIFGCFTIIFSSVAAIRNGYEQLRNIVQRD
ncbi:uncharacterized protein LOC132264325 [Phlebotomus argentipes]|uniref:uncharacterized protein LOC132264325 n=1 Tax=Phlebotomus argentipes TaxID=94469 RepID=UPI0028935E82|nr:uncharacterized protein LOC132264325 [Phlebotomus argentipes]